MSVEYYASARYGFADTYGHGSTSPMPNIPDLEDEGEAAGIRWLAKYDLDLLRFEPGGDEMSGPDRWAIVVKDLGVRASKWNEPDPVTRLGDAAAAAIEQLEEARRLLDRTDLQIGWMFLWDVR